MARQAIRNDVPELWKGIMKKSKQSKFIESLLHFETELELCKFEQGYISFDSIIESWEIDSHEKLVMITENTEE